MDAPTGAPAEAAVIWGSVGPAQQLSGSAADPGALGALRLLIGGFVVAAPLIGRSGWGTLFRRAAFPWVAAAAVSTAIYQTTFLYAVSRAGAGLGTTVALGCAPFATGAFSWWWLRQRPDWRWLTGTAAAVAGCALVLVPASGSRVDPVGVVFAIVSGCCYGAYTVAAKIFLDGETPALVTVACTLLLGGVLLTPLIAIHPAHLLDPATLALAGWIGIVGTAVAYALFAWGLAGTTATTAGTLSLAEPLAAVALGALILHEHFPVNATLGSLVLLSGLAVVAVPARRSSLPGPLPRPGLARPVGDSA